MQCDRCELWFHLLCIGLSTGDVAEDQDFVCKTCSHKPAAKPRPKVKKLNPKPPRPVVVKEEKVEPPEEVPVVPMDVDIKSELITDEDKRPSVETAEAPPRELLANMETLAHISATRTPNVVPAPEETSLESSTEEGSNAVTQTEVEEKQDAERQDEEEDDTTSKPEPKPERSAEKDDELKTEPQNLEIPPVSVEDKDDGMVEEKTVSSEENCASLDKETKPDPVTTPSIVSPNRSSDVTPVLEKLAALPMSAPAPITLNDPTPTISSAPVTTVS